MDVWTATLIVGDLAYLLAQRRQERGLSQIKAAADIGISQTSVERIEQGHNVRTDTLLLVLNWIIGDEEST